jgi:hypothetical protein
MLIALTKMGLVEKITSSAGMVQSFKSASVQISRRTSQKQNIYRRYLTKKRGGSLRINFRWHVGLDVLAMLLDSKAHNLGQNCE